MKIEMGKIRLILWFFIFFNEITFFEPFGLRFFRFAVCGLPEVCRRCLFLIIYSKYGPLFPATNALPQRHIAIILTDNDRDRAHKHINLIKNQCTGAQRWIPVHKFLTAAAAVQYTMCLCSFESTTAGRFRKSRLKASTFITKCEYILNVDRYACTHHARIRHVLPSC